KRRELELEAHDKAKPVEKANPTSSADSVPPDPELLKGLNAAEGIKKDIEIKIAQAEESLRVAERRQAVANRLLEKIGNFEKEFEVFSASLTDDATELGLKPTELVSVSANKSGVLKIRG